MNVVECKMLVGSTMSDCGALMSVQARSCALKLFLQKEVYALLLNEKAIIKKRCDFFSRFFLMGPVRIP